MKSSLFARFTLLVFFLSALAIPINAQEPPPTPVIVADVVQQPLQDHIELVGTVEPRRSSRLASETEGLVVARFRDIVEKYGGLKPLWETEAGAHCATFRKSYFDGAPPVGHQWVPRDDYRFTTAAWVRDLAASFAAGSRRYFFYWVSPTGLFSQQYDASNLIDFDGTPQPVAAAYATASRWFSDAEPAESLDLTDRVRAHLFSRPEGPFAVIYGTGMPSPATQTLSFSLPAARLRRIDMMGNVTSLDAALPVTLPVSSEPFFLLAESVSIPDLLSALRSAEIVGAPLPEPLLDKLADYRMKISDPFFRDYRFVGTVPDLGDVRAYRLTDGAKDVLVAWFGDAHGVVRDLPVARLALRVPAAQVRADDALERPVHFSSRGGLTVLEVGIVPVFLHCPGGTVIRRLP